MNKEVLRAISQLEDEILNINEMMTIDHTINRTLAANIISNKKLSIKALQEQLDRLYGCWLCEELLQNEFDFHEQKHSMQMMHGKVRIRFGNKEVTSFKANYCPSCGAKMEEVKHG